MRAVVTGDAGFLGRHFRRALDERYTVVGIDIKNGIDCRDFFSYDDGYYDLAIHCAGVVGGRDAIENRPLDLAVNLSLDAEFIDWTTRHARQAVYISSSAAYPISLQGRLVDDGQSDDSSAGWLAEALIHLDRPELPDELYGWIKLTGERLARLAFEAGERMLVIRPFSGYGSDQDDTYPFRAFVERARRRDDPFEIWGDGEQVRDFIHVDDIVDATLALLAAGYCGPVNLCTGNATSFNRLAHLVTAAAGYEPEFKHLTAAPVGVQHRVGDPTLMSRFYQPKVPLVAGIVRALADHPS